MVVPISVTAVQGRRLLQQESTTYAAILSVSSTKDPEVGVESVLISSLQTALTAQLHVRIAARNTPHAETNSACSYAYISPPALPGTSVTYDFSRRQHPF